ncbi:hypothetical protein CP082626L3_0671B, partial [Chlamydia psittaci 08-2626_L3]
SYRYFPIWGVCPN